jgi:23S rRNA (cytidine1920-2'-O)/16S rRNA (cytidine1409-2'-O)-methyltransferase
MSDSADCPYVSRGGIKLAAALRAFNVEPTGLVCADLGASVGGFTDCLLQHGARQVYAVDTAYGQFAWKLRQDRRVTLLERANVLHFEPTALEGFDGCGLVVVDLGWTPQRLAVPTAMKWLTGPTRQRGGRIITLIKPHYEAQPTAVRGRSGQRRGVLDAASARQVCDDVLARLPDLGVRVEAVIESPIRGGGGRGRAGNREWLALLVPAGA